jgi:hypothetical protein
MVLVGIFFAAPRALPWAVFSSMELFAGGAVVAVVFVGTAATLLKAGTTVTAVLAKVVVVLLSLLE